MADDIDIEEHDVLENPLIKRIFPDLTILKKEINDYNNYEHEESSQSSIVDESTSTTQEVSGVTELNQNASSSGFINNTFKNKIILGSKHSSSKHKKQNVNLCIKKAKVSLPNITQILNNNNTFCKICLILFPSQESLKRHTLLSHKSIQTNCMVKKNIENKLKRSYECQKCNTTFANVGNLNRHERNIHLNSKKNKKEGDDIHMTDDNDSNTTSLNESHLKECFHCDMMFTTQQLLIDHLYEVLNSKKTQLFKENSTSIQSIPTSAEDDKDQQIDIDEQTKTVEKKNVLENENIEQEHQSIENDSMKDINTDEIYVCPICSYCFNVWEFYEAHMKKKHSVNKVKRTNKVAYEPKCKFCDLHYSTYKSYNTHLHKRHKNKILQKVIIQSCNNVKMTITKETGKLMVQKKQQIVLESNQIKLDNTLKQQEINEEQFNFTKNDVKVMAFKTILFKCKQCDIHFLTTESAETHTNHNLLENSKCGNCQKYFKEKDMYLHLEQHKYSNYFSVIDISKDENVTAEIKRKNAAHTLHKCPLCAVHFNKEHISDHFLICETEPSQSTYCKICDILIAENMKISHGKEHDINDLKASDFKIVEFKNTRNKPIRRKKNTNPKMYEEKYLFNLSYCSVCKCNVARAHYKSTIHIQSRCSHFIKYVCKYCGLVFSNKSINTHRKLHQKFSNLTLKDFTFYDLKNGKKILPPIPVFPKCKFCEKHFITKIEVKRHVCYRNNHLTCPKCKMKLSHTAYKLHIPFHNLILNDVQKKTEKPLISDEVNLTTNIALNNDLEAKQDIITIFTCKNCVVSFNLYDEAINHCHLHTDLDTINPDTFECAICKLTYDASCHEEHQQLHKDFPEGTFEHIKFDVFNFGSPNDKWLKHMFGSMPQDVVYGIIKNAIYKYETRVKMRVVQNGSSDTTAYKCGRCQCFIDCHALYKHSKTCCESQQYICNICHLPITSSSNDEHEKCNLISKSYRIIEFNGKQDVNNKIANLRKCYILYECRLCHLLVDKNYEKHLCVAATSKECSVCGLLLSALDYDLHISKHKRLTSFNVNFMKVILLGSKPNVNNSFQRYSDVLSKFSGIVCDYSFYKCLNCDVCIKEQRNTSQHYCLIDAAKSKCPKCDLVFDEGKLKGHLKLHDTDPDFVKETIFVQTFDTSKLIKKIKSHKHTEENEGTACVNGKTAFDVKDQSNLSSNSEKPVKIYKCVCGLHYLTEATIKVHTKKCNGTIKTKQTKQNCSKCDLTFSPDVLFKHLIEHHGNKDILFQYEIIHFNLNL